MDLWRRLGAGAEPAEGVTARGPAEGTRPAARQIGRYAPYLRRYARALTGSQTGGDSLVQASIEGLLLGNIPLRADLTIRAALFAALHQAWRNRSADAAADASTPADLRLQTLSGEERAALLLTTMEAFSLGEAADVLQRPQEEVEDLLAEAEAALRRQLAARVLIIEDEPIIGLDLTRLARELGHTVVGVAATRSEAVALAAEGRPGLVLADVRLADGSSGMDAAADILQSFDIPVIFITAFPEHLLTGDRPEPAFLITKPFREDAVQALIGQALFFHRDGAGAAVG